MKAGHNGYMVTEMTGDMMAAINEMEGHVEIAISGFGQLRSFDLDGLLSFVNDLEGLQQLANQVERCNEPHREAKTE